ncbi:MAG: leucyl aminopeptidase [bacterium]|nr:leucyl aminopeptidase [bacterium]
MKFSLITNKQVSTSANIILTVFSVKDVLAHPLLKPLAAEDKKYIAGAIANAKLGRKDILVYNLPSAPQRRIVILGLGEKNKWSRHNLLLAARRIVVALKTHRIQSAIIGLDDFNTRGLTPASALVLAIQNMIMASFDFVDYKAKPEGGWPEIEEISIVCRPSKTLERALNEGLTIGQEVNECRRLSNTPGGIMTPRKLAQEALAVGKRIKSVKVKVLPEAKIKELGMGGVIGVSQGSSEKPQFIIMEYGPVKKTPIVFVGKGVTFDTGGLNLKPSDGIYEMHMDMSGGAAVIHAIEAIAKLKLPVRVIGLVPAVENMPSGSSYHPGDLLKTITGKTIEILNTDAEGRVILADGLGYAQRYKPSLVIDVATLTGAAVVALGQRTNALFSNKEKLLRLGKDVGDATGDYAWPMPLWEEYDDDIKGTFGDVANLGKTRYGGSITGAAFLKQFVGDFPWIHLDIAPMMTTIDGQYLSKGSSGAGVRFLVEMAKRFV